MAAGLARYHVDVLSRRIGASRRGIQSISGHDRPSGRHRVDAEELAATWVNEIRAPVLNPSASI